MLPACPVLYYTDTNNDHSTNWAESVFGRVWLANGEAMWQERLILPGYGTAKGTTPLVLHPS